MDTFITILTVVLSAITGGFIRELITVRSQRKKATIEVKKGEIETTEMISKYHRSEIEYLTNQIEELRSEMKKLTESNKELKKQLKRCETCKLINNNE